MLYLPPEYEQVQTGLKDDRAHGQITDVPDLKPGWSEIK